MSFDPRISEWGNPPSISVIPRTGYGLCLGLSSD
jgi:hypothetical protein